MTDYFGNSYWSARYFAAGYWGLDAEQDPGAISAHIFAGASVSATLTATGEVAVNPPRRLIPLQALFSRWRVIVATPVYGSATLAGTSTLDAALSASAAASATLAGASALTATLTATANGSAAVSAASSISAALAGVDRTSEHNNLMWLLAA